MQMAVKILADVQSLLFFGNVKYLQVLFVEYTFDKLNTRYWKLPVTLRMNANKDILDEVNVNLQEMQSKKFSSCFEKK